MTDPPAHRPRDAEATRRDLLTAARRRFAVLGYDRTTTRDVAQDAGVNISLINRYFGGKDGLFRAVVESAPQAVLEAPEGSGDLVGDFLDGLRPEAWPEFGSHPLLLLLRDSGAGEEVETLRAAGMAGGVARIIAWSGVDPGTPGSPRHRQVELRAQLVLALFNGIVALRSMAPIEPLASAEAGELRAAIEDAIAALVGLPD